MYGYGSTNPQHKPRITEIAGWGEPATFHPSCSCGWYGLVIDTYPPEAMQTIPALESLVKEYGAKQVYREKNRTHGVKDDALKQLLLHIDYNPELDAEYSMKKFTEILNNYAKSVKSKEYEKSLLILKKLGKANEELLNMEHRKEVFKNHQLDIVEYKPELEAKVKEESRKYSDSLSIGEKEYLDNA